MKTITMRSVKRAWRRSMSQTSLKVWASSPEGIECLFKMLEDQSQPTKKVSSLMSASNN